MRRVPVELLELTVTTPPEQLSVPLPVKLGYRPNPLARGLVTGKTGVLGILYSYLGAFIEHNPFETQLMTGVLEEAVRQRYHLMLHTGAGDNWNAAPPEAFLDPRVDGLVLSVPLENSPLVARCAKERFPAVAVVCEPVDGICTVNAGDFAGDRLATNHLVDLGHRRIAHLAGRPGVASTEPRRRGYLAALTGAGIQPAPELVVPGDLSPAGGHAAIEQLLSLPRPRWPTAVFAANDVCAQGALRAIRERGLRVPADIAVKGYD